MEYFYTLLLTYKYFVLLPIVIVEGPIILVIAGFLVSQGLLNIYAVWAIGVLGNVIGDIIYYSIGRVGRHTFIAKYGKYFGLREENVKYIEQHYKDHFYKTISIAKITEAPIIPTLVAAGIARVDFKKFLPLVAAIEIIKVFIILMVGYYFGQFYVVIGNYFKDAILALGITFALLAVLLFIYKKIQARKV